jgi:membrane protein YqaA with SNARE-associated domain
VPQERDGPALTSASARLTTWLLTWGDRRSGPVVLVVLTLLEATVFPAPTEAMLLALCISQPGRSPWFAALAAVGSVAGGFLGYQLGALTFEQAGLPLVQSLGFSNTMPAVEAAYRSNAWVALLTSGYTPIPYMLYTMAAGAFSIPIDTFVFGSLAGRTLKYLPIALLAWYFGPSVHRVASRYAAAAGVIITGLLIAAVLWRML